TRSPAPAARSAWPARARGGPSGRLAHGRLGGLLELPADVAGDGGGRPRPRLLGSERGELADRGARLLDVGVEGRMRDPGAALAAGLDVQRVDGVGDER